MNLILEPKIDNSLLTVFLQKIEYLSDEERSVMFKIIKQIYLPKHVQDNKLPIEEEWLKNKNEK